MEEEFADFFSDVKLGNIQMLNQIIQNSQKNGVQIGLSWKKDVYDYLFESGCNFDFSDILDMDVILAEVQQDLI